MSNSRTPGNGEPALARKRIAQRPPSMSEHVRLGLREEIIQGSLGPGERVSEEMVARAFGVSRTPIREALRILESEGLIVHRPGRGAVVAELVNAQEAELLFRVRVILEGGLARIAAEKITDGELEHLVEIHEAFCKLAESEPGTEEDRRILVLLDTDFHMCIYQASGANLLRPIVNSYWGQLLRELNRRDHDREHPVSYIAGHTLDKVVHEHKELVGAMREGDGDLAEALMVGHLEAAWNVMKITTA